MIEDIFQAVTSHPALISSYYVYKDMIQGIFQVVTSHPALISSYYVYKDVIEDIFFSGSDVTSCTNNPLIMFIKT